MAGSDTATSSETQSKNGESNRLATNDSPLQSAMLKANVANSTCDPRRGSRSSTEPPMARQTMAATSADTGWMLKVSRF